MIRESCLERKVGSWNLLNLTGDRLGGGGGGVGNRHILEIYLHSKVGVSIWPIQKRLGLALSKVG